VEGGDVDASVMHLDVSFVASKFAKNTEKDAHQKRVGVQQRIDDVSTVKFPELAKPVEPDFTLHTEDVH
jgi:cyclic nucleotide gated channel